MLKLGSIYPRGYIEPRSNIPGGTLDGGYVRFATPALGCSFSYTYYNSAFCA